MMKIHEILLNLIGIGNPTFAIISMSSHLSYVKRIAWFGGSNGLSRKSETKRNKGDSLATGCPAFPRKSRR